MLRVFRSKTPMVTVIPGNLDRETDRPPPRPTTDRWGGETYRVLWQEAIAAKPDWVLILLRQHIPVLRVVFFT